MLSVKADDLDPDAAKFVQGYRATICRRFAQKECEKKAKIEFFGTDNLSGFIYMADIW